MSFHTFLRVSLGLSLSGISFLGFVIPGALRNNPIVYNYVSAIMYGSLLAIVTNFAPAKIISTGYLNAEYFLLIQSAAFAFSLAVDLLSDCDISFKQLHQYFESLLIEYRNLLARSTARIARTEIEFSRVSSEETENSNISPFTNFIEDDEKLNSIETFPQEHRSFDASLVILVIGILLGLSKGLYIGSESNINLVEVLKFHLFNIYIAYSISSYMIIMNIKSKWSIFFIALFSLSPLFGSILFLSPHYLYDLVFDPSIDALLSALCSGGFLYISTASGILGVIISDTSSHVSMKHYVSKKSIFRVILVLTGYLLTYLLGVYFTFTKN